MASYVKDSSHKPERVLQEAERYFGSSGLGLDATQQGVNVVVFTGGGGHVLVRATAKDRGSEVEIETREWDQVVPGFLQAI